MQIHDVIIWLSNNWLNLIQWIGDIIAIDAVIKQVALKYGFNKLVSICDLIANDLGFILDVLGSIPTAFKKQPTNPPATPLATQKVD